MEEQEFFESTSLNVWAKMNGVDNIEVLKGKGRMWANTAVGKLFFSSSVDLKKPLFVGKGRYDELWVFNQNAKVVETISF